MEIGYINSSDCWPNVVVVHNYNLTTWEAEARGSEFEASATICLKKKKKLASMNHQKLHIQYSMKFLKRKFTH